MNIQNKSQFKMKEYCDVVSHITSLPRNKSGYLDNNNEYLDYIRENLNLSFFELLDNKKLHCVESAIRNHINSENPFKKSDLQKEFKSLNNLEKDYLIYRITMGYNDGKYEDVAKYATIPMEWHYENHTKVDPDKFLEYFQCELNIMKNNYKNDIPCGLEVDFNSSFRDELEFLSQIINKDLKVNEISSLTKEKSPLDEITLKDMYGDEHSIKETFLNTVNGEFEEKTKYEDGSKIESEKVYNVNLEIEILDEIINVDLKFKLSKELLVSHNYSCQLNTRFDIKDSENNIPRWNTSNSFPQRKNNIEDIINDEIKNIDILHLPEIKNFIESKDINLSLVQDIKERFDGDNLDVIKKIEADSIVELSAKYRDLKNQLEGISKLNRINDDIMSKSQFKIINNFTEDDFLLAFIESNNELKNDLKEVAKKISYHTNTITHFFEQPEYYANEFKLIIERAGLEDNTTFESEDKDFEDKLLPDLEILLKAVEVLNDKNVSKEYIEHIYEISKHSFTTYHKESFLKYNKEIVLNDPVVSEILDKNEALKNMLSDSNNIFKIMSAFDYDGKIKIDSNGLKDNQEYINFVADYIKENNDYNMNEINKYAIKAYSKFKANEIKNFMEGKDTTSKVKNLIEDKNNKNKSSLKLKF